MPAWLTELQAILQILQATGLLQVFIQVINQIITDIANAVTPAAAVQKQLPAIMKIYAKLPPDKQAVVDQIILRL